MPDVAEKFAQANGVTLCYETFGAPADPAMILIMGLGVQMIWWEQEFCERLAARGFFVVRFDNRDIGRSWRCPEPPPNFARVMAGLEPLRAPYSLDDMARDTLGLMDALKLERAHVVGVSMGGMIAQLMAIGAPERIESLTSIMSTTGERNLPPPRPGVMATLMAPPPAGSEAFINASVVTARLLRGYDDAQEDADARARAQRAAARGLDPAGPARQMAAVGVAPGRSAALARLSVPVLVIHGSDDPLIPVEAGRATARAIPGAKLLEFDRMGHTLPRAHWSVLVDAIAAHAKAAQK